MPTSEEALQGCAEGMTLCFCIRFRLHEQHLPVWSDLIATKE